MSAFDQPAGEKRRRPSLWWFALAAIIFTAGVVSFVLILVKGIGGSTKG